LFNKSTELSFYPRKLWGNVSAKFIGLVFLLLCTACQSHIDKVRFQSYTEMSCEDLRQEILRVDRELNSYYQKREPSLLDMPNPANYMPGVLSMQKLIYDKEAKGLNKYLADLNIQLTAKKCDKK
jgi:hypothetical protein